MTRFWNKPGQNIRERAEKFENYVLQRLEYDLWPYQLTIDTPGAPWVEATFMNGKKASGYNFTSVDYLGLSRDPRLTNVAIETTRRFGFHSNSSGPLMGNNPVTRALENTLCEWLQKEYIQLFPNGWSACFGAITGIVRDSDHIIIDELAHQSLQQGAYAATKNVTKFKHSDLEDYKRKISSIRATNPRVGILTVTETLFSMDSTITDMPKIATLAKEFESVLMVSVMI